MKDEEERVVYIDGIPHKLGKPGELRSFGLWLVMWFFILLGLTTATDFLYTMMKHVFRL